MKLERSERLEKEIIDKWYMLLDLEKSKGNQKAGRAATYRMRKELSEKALKYITKVFAILKESQPRTEKLIDAFEHQCACEVCSNICRPSQHFICGVCYAKDIPKYRKIRKDRAQAASQKERTYSLKNRSEEAKSKTLNKFRITMAKNWEGGHSMRDPTFKEMRRKKHGYLSPFELPEIREKGRLSSIQNSGVDATTEQTVLRKKNGRALV